MIPSKKAESVVSVIVVISIVSLMLLALLWILQYDAQLDQDIQNLNQKNILTHNTKAILDKIPLNNIQANEQFFLHKVENDFEVLTGSENEKFQFINARGNYFPPDSQNGTLFQRTCIMKKDKDDTPAPLCQIKITMQR